MRNAFQYDRKILQNGSVRLRLFFQFTYDQYCMITMFKQNALVRGKRCYDSMSINRSHEKCDDCLYSPRDIQQEDISK